MPENKHLSEGSNDLSSTQDIINSVADLPALVGNEYLLLPNTKYMLGAPIVLGPNHIRMSQGTMLDSVCRDLTVITKNPTTGAAIRGTNVSCVIREIKVDGADEAYNFTGTKTEQVTIDNCSFTNQVVRVGTANMLYFFSYINIAHAGNTNGILITDSSFVLADNTSWFSTNTGINIDMPSGAFESIKITNNSMDITLGNVGININEALITHTQKISTVGNFFVGTSLTYTTGFNPLDGDVRSYANLGISNIVQPESVTNVEMFAIVNPDRGGFLFNTDLGTNGEMVYHNGVEWESLNDSIIFQTSFTETFETGLFTTNGWVLTPDSLTNFHLGSIGAIGGGSFGAYLSDDGGLTADYPKNTAQVTHLHIDLLLPTNIVASRIFLQFDWLCEGTIGQDFCELHDVTNVTTPIAGTQLGVTGLIGQQYANKLSKQTETIELPIIEAGTTRRFIWSWVNNADGNRVKPPIKLDNINILYIP